MNAFAQDSIPPAVPDHELLRVIGRGSYGEVWLARNVMGTWRAVKIVRRASFDSDRPYRREFDGIRRSEPVSRAHEGMVDVLHMGRSEDDSFFYYVMELADSVTASPSKDPEAYKPLTLSARIGSRQPPDADDCLRIAVTLAGALAHLHESGLIHRDVKPSNVLYIGGVPKLGDIGLVAEAGGSRSFVGTEGFVPQEGPGTERADLYGLGKTLYEAITGLDRTRYPELPENWPQLYDFPQRLELNEIVLRACESDAERRYHSAREMLADAAILSSGRSVKRLRSLESRVRMARRGLIALAGAALLAGGAFVWAQRENALTRERAERAASEARAAAAEHEARISRWYSLLDRVRAARRDVTAGAVTAGLKAAAEAAALQTGGPESLLELRNETAFLLGRSDLTPGPPRITPGPSQPGTLLFDPAHRQCLHLPYPLLAPAESRAGLAELTSLDSPPFRFPHSFTTDHGWGLVFSPDGTRLLDPDITGQRPAVVWTLTESTAAEVKAGATPPVDTRWLEDGSMVFSHAPGDVVFYSPEGKETRRITVPGWQAQRLFPSPGGRQILLFDTAATLRMLDVATGEAKVWHLPSDSAKPREASWGADGIWLAITCGFEHSKDERIYTFRADITGPVIASRQSGGGVSTTFMDAPHLLCTSGWGGATWVEDLIHAQPVLKERSVAGQALRYGGGLLALHGWQHQSVDLFAWHPSPVLHVLGCAPEEPERLTFSPDDRWLAAGGRTAMQWWQLDPLKSSAPLRTDAVSGQRLAQFSPDSKTVRCFAPGGITEYAFHPEARDSTSLLTQPTPTGWSVLPFGAVSTSRDGRCVTYSGQGPVIVMRDGKLWHSLTVPPDAAVSDVDLPLSLDADARHLAIGSHHLQTAWVWSLPPDGEPVLVHEEKFDGGTTVAFSPDGRWLICGGASENRVLDTATWKVVMRWPRQGSGQSGHTAWSPDGTLLILQHTREDITLHRTGTWEQVLQLKGTTEEALSQVTLSPRGRWLAALGTHSEIWLWDLTALRHELTTRALPLPATP